MNEKRITPSINQTTAEPYCDDSLRLENQLCHRLYVVSNAITRAYRPFLQQLNLTYPQFVVMMSLWAKDGVEIRQLRQRTRIDAGALTLILNKLVDKGLISRQLDSEDRRRKIIRLTTAGRALHDTALSHSHRLGCHENPLSAEEHVQMMNMMDKLIGSLLIECDGDS